jgi:hypothetical protein
LLIFKIDFERIKRRNKMNTLRMKILTLALAAGLIASAAAFAESADFGAKGAEGRENLTREQMLTYAIQDEYLARAEYELIIAHFGEVRPFTNIIKAEEQHIAWLVELFAGYGIDLPEDTAEEHVSLPADLKAAFQTGVQAEIENIAMYAAFLEKELPADVAALFAELKAASENHLRAFQNNLNRYN